MTTARPGQVSQDDGARGGPAVRSGDRAAPSGAPADGGDRGRAPAERLTAVAGGAALGAFCLVADRLDLVDWIEQLASTWVLLAAYVGSRAGTHRRAATAGLVALLTATAVYYGGFLAALASPTVVLLWAVIAVAVGPVAGVVGRATRSEVVRTRVAAAALLGASPVAEALALWPHLDHPDVRAMLVVMVLVGVALPGVVLRDEPAGRRSVAAAAAVVGGLATAPLVDAVLGAVGLV